MHFLLEAFYLIFYNKIFEGLQETDSMVIDIMVVIGRCFTFIFIFIFRDFVPCYGYLGI